ncbi:MAG TPA: diguanylate cyclase [Acidimicrobiales bacterium]|nr:diguanylate cyclase [Acidimicrobiales bacterium]
MVRPEHDPPEAPGPPAEAASPRPDGPAAPPDAPLLLGIDHVQLAMPAGHEAVAAAHRFYGDLLGLRPVPKPPALAVRGGCWFEGPQVTLHLGVEDPFRPARKAHPVLVVADLGALAARITAAGHDVRPAEDVPGTVRAHTDDPFGNRIELVQASGPTAESFAAMADHALFPVSLIDPDGTIVWAGASMERFFGWRPDQLVGTRFDSVVAPQSLGEVYEAFGVIDEAFEITPWGGVGLPVDLVHADGRHLPCELSVLTTRRTGLPWYVVHVRRVGYERALDLAIGAMGEGAPVAEVLAELVAALEEMVPETAVAIGDRWTGNRFEATAGRAGGLLEADPCAPWTRAVHSGKDHFAELDELPPALAARARAEGYEACWVHPVALPGDGEPAAAIVVWRTRAGRPSRFNWTTVRRVGHLLRLTLQWDRSHTTLRFAATHDPLTGLANRPAFIDRLAAVARSGEDQAAVIYLDLDHFKPVNEQLGHPVGDRVLAAVGGRLLDALRPGDLVARIGGDEFAVLCERLTTPDAVEVVAARLLEVLREPITPLPGSSYEVHLDASIGVASVAEGPVDDVLQRADDAMRAAKTSGRGRWVRDSAGEAAPTGAAVAQRPGPEGSTSGDSPSLDLSAAQRPRRRP